MYGGLEEEAVRDQAALSAARRPWELARKEGQVGESTRAPRDAPGRPRLPGALARLWRRLLTLTLRPSPRAATAEARGDRSHSFSRSKRDCTVRRARWAPGPCRPPRPPPTRPVAPGTFPTNRCCRGRGRRRGCPGWGACWGRFCLAALRRSQPRASRRFRLLPRGFTGQRGGPCAPLPPAGRRQLTPEPAPAESPVSARRSLHALLPPQLRIRPLASAPPAWHPALHPVPPRLLPGGGGRSEPAPHPGQHGVLGRGGGDAPLQAELAPRGSWAANGAPLPTRGPRVGGRPCSRKRLFLQRSPRTEAARRPSDSYEPMRVKG